MSTWRKSTYSGASGNNCVEVVGLLRQPSINL